ncbi:MAG: hypothetical protein ABSG25_08150 [Bryobacteraceae bacterium]
MEVKVPTLEIMMAEIVGSCLSSVEFIHDYIQFRFDGPCLTTYNNPSITIGAQLLEMSDEGYRDGLCSLIGVQVESVNLGIEELVIRFTNAAILAVSFRNEDYHGPEAMEYSGTSGPRCVI